MPRNLSKKAKILVVVVLAVLGLSIFLYIGTIKQNGKKDIRPIDIKKSEGVKEVERENKIFTIQNGTFSPAEATLEGNSTVYFVNKDQRSYWVRLYYEGEVQFGRTLQPKSNITWSLDRKGSYRASGRGLNSLQIEVT